MCSKLDTNLKYNKISCLMLLFSNWQLEGKFKLRSGWDSSHWRVLCIALILPRTHTQLECGMLLRLLLEISAIHAALLSYFVATLTSTEAPGDLK